MDFPIEEYQARLERVRAEMATHQLPVLLLHQPENICYLSGLYLPIGTFAYHALVVPLEHDPVLVLRDTEEPTAREKTWVSQRVHWSDVRGDWFRAMQRVLEALGLARGRIGIEHNSWFLTLERYFGLRQHLPEAAFVEEPQIVERLRLVKSPQEVAYIREAARVADAAMAAGIEAAVPGASEQDLAVAVTTAQIRAGGEYPLGGLIASGERTVHFHGVWSDRRLRTGDPIFFEPFGIVRMYHARFVRTVVLGKATAEQARTAEVLLGALEAGISRIGPGVAAAEVDEALRGPVVRSGVKQQDYTHQVGYSLGLINRPTPAERLWVLPGATWVFQPGMVFHIELLAQGIGFGETVLVTASGREVLTRYPRRFVSP